MTYVLANPNMNSPTAINKHDKIKLGFFPHLSATAPVGISNNTIINQKIASNDVICVIENPRSNRYSINMGAHRFSLLRK